MGKIKLFAVYNKAQELLKEIFVQTLQDDLEINLTYLDMPTGDFKSSRHNDILKQKHIITRDAIKANFGDIILTLDVDIQFFGKCTEIILSQMKDCDIVFQARSTHPKQWTSEDEVNTGFMAIRCNDRTLALFEGLLKLDWSLYGNQAQATINYLLKTKKVPDLRYGVMPETFWHPKWPSGSYPPKDIVLHHAIQGQEPNNMDKDVRLELKLRQLKNIRRYVEGYSCHAWLPFRILYQLPYRLDVYFLIKYKTWSAPWFLQKIVFSVRRRHFPNITSIFKNLRRV